jgi:hypothetical protein
VLDTDVPFSPRSMFDRTDDAKGTGAAQGSLFGIPADAVAKGPPKLSPEEMRELYPGIRPGETVAKYEKRMGTSDTPVMFAPATPIAVSESAMNAEPASLRRRVREHLEAVKSTYPAGIVNEPTGRRIKLSSKGNRKVVNNLGDLRRAVVALHIEDVLRVARLVSSDKNVNDQNIRAFHRLQTSAVVDGRRLPVMVLVREDANGDWFYNLDVAEVRIENPPAYQAPTDSVSGTPALGGSSE